MSDKQIDIGEHIVKAICEVLKQNPLTLENKKVYKFSMDVSFDIKHKKIKQMQLDKIEFVPNE